MAAIGGNIVAKVDQAFIDGIKRLPHPNTRFAPDAFPAVAIEDGPLPKLQRRHSVSAFHSGAYGEYAASQLKQVPVEDIPATTVRYTPVFSTGKSDLDSFTRSFKNPDGTYGHTAIRQATGLSDNLAEDNFERSTKPDSTQGLPSDTRGLPYTLKTVLAEATNPKPKASRIGFHDLRAMLGVEDFWLKQMPEGKITPAKRRQIEHDFFNKGNQAQESNPYLTGHLYRFNNQERHNLKPLLEATEEERNNPLVAFQTPLPDRYFDSAVAQGRMAPDIAAFGKRKAAETRPYAGQRINMVMAKQNDELRDQQNREGFNRLRNTMTMVNNALAPKDWP